MQDNALLSGKIRTPGKNFTPSLVRDKFTSEIPICYLLTLFKFSGDFGQDVGIPLEEVGREIKKVYFFHFSWFFRVAFEILRWFWPGHWKTAGGGWEWDLKCRFFYFNLLHFLLVLFEILRWFWLGRWKTVGGGWKRNGGRGSHSSLSSPTCPKPSPCILSEFLELFKCILTLILDFFSAKSG